MTEARRSTMTAPSTSTSTSLKDYLKRYESAGQEQHKKKKKKKITKNSAHVGVLVVDEDPVWGKPVIPDAEEEPEAEDTPVVDEDVEVKRMRRLELIRSRKPYHSLSEDGSGWVSITKSSSRSRFDTPSPEPSRKHSKEISPDLSPPRRRNSVAPNEDLSPPRRRKISPSRESSLSPPRRRNLLPPDIDLSPPRKGRISPPRRRNASPSDEDLSPPRRRKILSPQESNLSPPRRRNSSLPIEDLSPPRRRNKVASKEISLSLQPDLSPPRIRRSFSRGEDLSPPRRRKHTASEDLSPPRKRQNQAPAVPDKDLHPPRKRRNRTPTPPNSPRRERKVKQMEISPRREKKVIREDPSFSKQGSSPSTESKKKQPPMKEGRRAGLFTGREIKEEIDRKEEEELSRFNALDPSLSGRDAEPVYRNKEGKRISKEEMLKMQKGEEKPKEKKLEWGKGLVQKREAETQTMELEREKEKPFARSRDDPELDKMLRERTRWGDPMAHLVKKKQQLDPVLEDLGDDEKMKESGFIIPQGIPIHSWLKRGVDAPVNRYGIRPGRHWDGVDRSNGFEKQMFQRQNERRATEAEAYLWSVSDM